MRSLILHTNVFESSLVAASNRPFGIVPEDAGEQTKRMENCLTVLFCVEKEDTEKQLGQLYQEIITCAREVKTMNIMLFPFVHLSKDAAAPSAAIALYQQLKGKFENTPLTVDHSHFGYAKTVLLDIKGHRCAYKYREF